MEEIAKKTLEVLCRPVGRPKKYTEEEARENNRKRALEQYHKKKLDPVWKAMHNARIKECSHKKRVELNLLKAQLRESMIKNTF